MSTDRELLKLAAKAAGYHIWARDHTYDVWHPNTEWTTWNPLTDDGDAMRLAVKLNMTLAVGIARSDAGEFTEFGLCGEDPYAATRRAIVRAAAETGRSMK